VLIGVLLTPAWFLPLWPSRVWQLAVAILGLPALWLAWRHAPWQPTPAAERARILHHLGLTSDQTFADLGAGDGRLVAWVHDATGARALGWEASALPWLVAWLRLLRRPGATVHLADLYRADLSEVDAAYVWGTAYSVAEPRFGQRMVRALKPGARLLSYHHPVHGLDPVAVDDDGQRPLYVYTMPPRTRVGGPEAPVGEGGGRDRAQ